MNFHTSEPYGTGDASFQAAGGEADFKKYLMEQLFVPAEAVRRRCANAQDIY